MPNKNKTQTDNPNIGKNTKWDTPEVNPNAGSTIQKPPTFLNPDKKNKK
tara:strand:+ start:2658 stop:2804 length:147 start_codon:yes stop_codon:yes gene_type:complete